MASNFHETYAEQKLVLPSDRSTGLVFTVALAIAAWLGRHHALIVWPALVASAGFLAVALLAPALLRPLNIAWMKLAMLMSRIVSPVVMGVLFLLTIVPFGIAMQIVRDPLRRKRTADQTSYWIERHAEPGAPAQSMTNQF